jgi:hypothetical protein
MKRTALLSFPLLAATLLAPGAARAHCDTLDGPVIGAARQALENGRIEPVLAWVQPGDEQEIRQAFAETRTVRKTGTAARALADRWFFETLVRVHRAGEGAPYTGLKPSGTPDPAVAAADAVAAGGDAKALEALLVGAVREGLHEHVAELRKERPPASDVAAGRRWVSAYVPFVHWAEGVLAAAGSSAAHGEAHGQAGDRDEVHGAVNEHAAPAHHHGATAGEAAAPQHEH